MEQASNVNWGDTRLPRRFWEKTSPEPTTGCWIWIGRLDQTGYGRFDNPTSIVAHRVSYLALVGVVPVGLEDLGGSRVAMASAIAREGFHPRTTLGDVAAFVLGGML